MFKSQKKKLQLDLNTVLIDSALHHRNWRLYLPIQDIREHQFHITPNMLSHALYWVSVSKMFHLEPNHSKPKDVFSLNDRTIGTKRFIIWMHEALTCSPEDITAVFKKMPVRNSGLKADIWDIRVNVDVMVQNLITKQTKLREEQDSAIEEFNSRIPIRPQLNGSSLLEWLEHHGPDPELWHCLLSELDWGEEGEEVFGWVVRQAECDAATAAEAFHIMNPFDHLVPSSFEFHNNVADSLKHIIMRWENKNFRTYTYEFKNVLAIMQSYEQHREYELKAMGDFGHINFIAPPSLFECRAGKTPKSNYRYI